MTSQSIADDVTMTRHLWHDHVNNDIYNSLDIDFIHGDIHGRSCKNQILLVLLLLLSLLKQNRDEWKAGIETLSEKFIARPHTRGATCWLSSKTREIPIKVFKGVSKSVTVMMPCVTRVWEFPMRVFKGSSKLVTVMTPSVTRKIPMRVFKGASRLVTAMAPSVTRDIPMRFFKGASKSVTVMTPSVTRDSPLRVLRVQVSQ